MHAHTHTHTHTLSLSPALCQLHFAWSSSNVWCLPWTVCLLFSSCDLLNCVCLQLVHESMCRQNTVHFLSCIVNWWLLFVVRLCQRSLLLEHHMDWFSSLVGCTFLLSLVEYIMLTCVVILKKIILVSNPEYNVDNYYAHWLLTNWVRFILMRSQLWL